MNRSSYYEELRQKSNITTIARELLGDRITQESNSTLLVDCPHHQSTSRKSFHVDAAYSRFRCWGCDVFGDVIDLVEFVQHGRVSSGGSATTSHRDARDWLAERVNVEPLSRYGLPAEKVDAIEVEERRRARVFSCLTALAEIQNARLFSREDLAPVREALQSNYGIRADTAVSLLIGLAHDSDFERLQKRGFTATDILHTGAFYDNHRSIFHGRIVFPYWRDGRVVYAIGRRTNLTPSTPKGEPPKYRKLLTQGQNKKFPFVSEYIRNDVLFGEDVLRASPRPETVVITEGVTDAIAGQQAGIPTISPVTVRITERDMERIAPKLEGIKRVVIIQDNEISGVGIRTALENARKLRDRDVEALVARIPLDSAQVAARAALAELLGGESRLGELEESKPAETASLLTTWTDGKADPAEVAQLRSAAKTDLALWLRDRTADDLAALVAAARHPVEFAIEAAPAPRPADGIVPAEEPIDPYVDILDEISRLDAAARLPLIELVHRRSGVPKGQIKAIVAEAAKKHRGEKQKGPKDLAGALEQARAAVLALRSDTCRRLIELARQVYRSKEIAVDWRVIGEAVFQWFDEAGARFFVHPEEPFARMFWSGSIVPVSTSNRTFAGIMFQNTGAAGQSTSDRELLGAFRLCAETRGAQRTRPFSWSEYADGVYVSLIQAPDILRIAPDGVTAVRNGDNEAEVILTAPSHFEPLSEAVTELSLPGGKPPSSALSKMIFENSVGRHLACPDAYRALIGAYVATIPLFGLIGTRAFFRFEGQSGSGKTFAAKMVTTLVLGATSNQESTTASLWSLGQSCPLLSLDNVEGNRIQEDNFRQFLLTSSTGAVRVKRAMSTDHGVSIEYSNAFVLMSGIESLGAELREIASRTISVPFELDRQGGPIVESDVLQGIRERREAYWRATLPRLAEVVRLISDGGLSRVMQALGALFGAGHPKGRLSEHLGVIYLYEVASRAESQREALLDSIDPAFADVLRSLTERTDQAERMANPVVTSMATLFTWLANGQRLAGIRYADCPDDGVTEIQDVKAANLFIGIKAAAKDYGIPAPFRTPKHLGERLVEGLPLLTMAGFHVTYSNRNKSNVNLYTIRWSRDGGEPGGVDLSFLDPDIEPPEEM